MQDIHSMGGGGGRLFGGGIGGGVGGGGGGDRRMRAHHQHHGLHHQSLKCPRCDSLNTKFCYYNNYNLSQPRHFCKSCRRYWTKGGVLRNVPVGGGCRKAKRAKSKQPNNQESTTSSTAFTAATTEKRLRDETREGKSGVSHSSSESSSLTASNSNTPVTAAAGPNSTTVPSASATEVVSEHSSLPVVGFLNGKSSSKLYGNGIEWSAFLEQGSSEGGIFPEIGSFKSLIATSSTETMPFGFGGNMVNQQCFHQWQQNGGDQVRDHHHLKVEGVPEGLFDGRTALVEFPGGPSDPKGGYGSLDWAGGGGDQGLFDLTNTVDHAYWSQSQWTTDHGAYLP